ncbi:Cytochrome c heme lyase subunit CcmF [hydrothermal vent metagenome]|uniref:Cytochrome c heme lyase subunit CcmF n=1 Tax=hydrothermal vent metagenome TaxID=652676 RepID=A0A3B0UBZ0_9ZZZZ
MIAEIGHFALLLALTLAVVQSTVPLWGATKGDTALMGIATPAAQGQFVLVTIAFFALMYGYITSDFSIQNVWANSHTAKPLVYKITGVWGNHEGSMLLWVAILALFGALVATFGNNLAPGFKARVLSVQGMICLAFLLFLIVTSNPFTRLDPAPISGRDLNPLLQDMGLALHPPFLYLGYVGFSVAFSFAIAALIEGRVDAAWARWVRPWTLVAWINLTIGNAVGSWWAYYELGWGGWWFWDPVENASFMPWLAGTALLHSAIVVEKRDSLKVWTILLAILTFSLSLLGAFLVRSGILTSVHAFAVDPARGVFILFILAFFVGGSLALYAWRAPALKGGGLFAPVSREGALIFNNLFLTTACAAVFVGTLYPLFLESVTGAKISVGAPFFNATFIPLILPLLIAIPFGENLAWKRGRLLGAAQRLAAAFGLAIVGTVVVAWVVTEGPAWAPLGIGLSIWLIVGAFTDLAVRIYGKGAGVGAMISRAVGLPRAAWGAALAHAGVGIMVLGIVGITAWRAENILIMEPGQSTEVASYTALFEGAFPRQGPNYSETVGRFKISKNGKPIGTIESSKRIYTVQETPTTEAGIRTSIAGDLYIAIGDEVGDGLTVRLWSNPLVVLIWIGALIMSLGGLVSLTDRRLRIGVPRRARKSAAEPTPETST